MSHIEANGKTKRKRSSVSRREQCRANQQRYRNKQRNHQLELEQSVEQLHQELDSLKWRRRDLTSRERISHGPWTIVAEVFHLLETSFRSPWRLTNTEEMLKHADIRHSLAFLRESFADDVSMGDLTGADMLMEQLRRYSLYFGDPQTKLNRIEAVASGVMRATATLSVTVTDFTLRHVLPHLEKPVGRGEEDEHQSLREKLMGARLTCECSMTLLSDEQSGRIVRLMASIDLLPSLIRLLGGLENLSSVLDHAMFSQECVVGGNMDHQTADKLSSGSFAE
ncbi:hypothetical protein BBO99_00008099 [Phytophthora kernoviae]|uniref:Bzip transcription factor n=1 Tax=Phytophthora kernoviae TaxID=325452 RepID=A0A421EYH7_9STRA|nr:hypothetical protein JM18_007627 [Phytophthora kernoviae]RLN10518.1 hypothetical protein BBI17_008028 [Phytophthora kernoviae]RLN75742.1 hypothetical protein BBO99_00008099 [Phytophthora kernoviae]